MPSLVPFPVDITKQRTETDQLKKESVSTSSMVLEYRYLYL